MPFPAPNLSPSAPSAFPPAEHPNYFPPPGSTRDTSANLATLAVPPPGSGTGSLDALTNPQPLNSRRPGAPTLPSFELPAPNFHLGGAAPKSPHHHGLSPPTSVSVGNLLTPPATTNQSGDVTSPGPPASTAVATSSDLPPSYTAAYWPGQSPYGPSAPLPRQQWPPALNTTFPPSRLGFSPLNHVSRSQSTSSPVSEGMSQPYDIHPLPPFQQPPSVPSPGVQTSAVPQQRSMAHPMMGAHSAPPNSIASPHPLASGDPYGPPKSQSAPLYGATQHMPSIHQGYPPPPSPYSSSSGLGIQPSGRVPSGQSPPVSGQPPHFNYPRQPYPSNSLPAMSGPVMTNVHSPNGQMSLVGGMQPALPPAFNSGHFASMQHMYGGHPPPPGHGPPGTTNESRPFRCEQCSQSFNRNHDLKRHKRIHLSVKPFNCSHCKKAFSRKDALKVMSMQVYVRLSTDACSAAT